jgi:alkylhydroperoxidase/carboxymuconolactone decarboxylase family protein YurZ
LLRKEVTPVVDVEDLRDIALHLQGRLGPLLGFDSEALDTGLDVKSQSLVCLGALHALDACDATYQRYVTLALVAGCTPGEVVGTLITVGALVGESRAVSDARPLALALGYDIDHAIESGFEGDSFGGSNPSDQKDHSHRRDGARPTEVVEGLLNED